MSSKSSRKQKNVVDDPKDNVFLVEKVLDKRSGKAGRDEFLIQWQGFPPSDSSWEPRENLQCLQMLEDFERDFVKREKPTRKRRASAVDPPKTEEAAVEEKKEKAVDPDDKYSLNGKQLRCILGLTKGPGELHFLCKFSDDTAQLLPSKEVNSRYRPFVDEYHKFLHRRLEKRQKRMDEGKKKGDDEDDDDEWPNMPPGMRILTSEEQEQKLREESRHRESEEMSQTFQLTATDLLHDMQMAADSHFLSSTFQSDPMEESESTALSEPLLSVFDERNDSPLPCPIVIDTLDNDDDDVLLFPPTI